MSAERRSLADHLRGRHPRVKVGTKPLAVLQREHRREHHCYRTNHVHAGLNLGPGNRPAGWYTGLDVEERP